MPTQHCGKISVFFGGRIAPLNNTSTCSIRVLHRGRWKKPRKLFKDNYWSAQRANTHTHAQIPQTTKALITAMFLRRKAQQSFLIPGLHRCCRGAAKCGRCSNIMLDLRGVAGDPSDAARHEKRLSERVARKRLLISMPWNLKFKLQCRTMRVPSGHFSKRLVERSLYSNLE